MVSGCPSTELTIARVREATEALGIETNLRVVIVDGEEHAQLLEFRGSPTVRVERVDVEELASERPVALASRLYDDGKGELERAPPFAWIHAALARSAPTLGPAAVR